MKENEVSALRRTVIGHVVGATGVLIAVLALLPFRTTVNSTPVALAFLLVVVFTAAGYGSLPAFFASVASMFCFNYFFLQPYYTLTVADPQNWLALAAFLVSSWIVGGVSARERARTEEAETRKKDIERLYAESREAFEKASLADAIKQSEQMKSALLDAVTHDLRTPLTSMKAAATTLLAGGAEPGASLVPDEEGRRELLEVIDTEIDRLNRLLEGLIEMAKIEAGAMHPRRAWSNMEEIVSICLARAARLTSRHRVRVDIEENLPPVRADEKAIAQVLHVLMENATKYSQPDTDIVVSVKRSGNESLKVSVEDRGLGIPPAMREKVFDKFFRFSAPDSAAPRPSGLGMGLAIARAIVEAHNGRIWIEEPASGRGTRVCFTLPLKEAAVAAMVS